MKPFDTKADFVATLTTLWKRIADTPAIAEALSGTKLVARFRFTDFDTDLYIDTKQGPLTFYWDPELVVRPDVDMILSSETGHRFWMEDLNVPLAIARRNIVAKGSVQKALKLLPALKPAFALYPEVLREMGKGDLLAQRTRPISRRRSALFGKRKPRDWDRAALPHFPMALSSKRARVPGTPGVREEKKVSEAELLRTMYRIRFFEEHLAEAFRRGDLPTEAIHLSIGQEAVAAAVCLSLRDTDYLNTTHRGHGHIIAKGADINTMMAEIYGKAAGPCEGKGGSMHVTDRAIAVLGANGIVGAGYLLAMGAGFTIQHEHRDDLSVVIAGDGSVNQGMFHEAANMIAVLQLPVLIVIENNLYGEFTPIERHSGVPEIFKRATAYNIHSQRLDGNDAQGLYAAVRETIAAMRQDGRPRLLEVMTYRWHGHMEGDPERYRSNEEKERFMRADPMARLERDMLQGGMEPSAIERIRAEARAEVGQAVAFAHDAATPARSMLFTDVYAPDDESLFQGTLPPVNERPGLRQMSVAQAVNEAIAEEMARDQKVFLWGEDVTLGGYFNVTEGLVERFGDDRVIDTPISENGIVGGAVGAAMTGMRPVAEILFADFLTCCMDPILNQAAKLRYMTGGQVSIPLTIRTPLGSGIGMAAQHSQSMERFFFGIPGLIVVAPSDAYTAKGLLKSAIRSNNPILFFEHKLLYADTGPVPDEDYLLPLGKARVVREGEHVTIVTHLLGVGVALDAAKRLEERGIRAEVVDLATLYPLDSETILASVAKTRRLVTLEEGPATGGIGAEVIARVSLAGFNLLKSAPVRIAGPECPIPYAKDLENAMMPDPEALMNRVAALCASGRGVR